LDGSSLYLVGMMGSGKSTVGKMVAAALEYPYVDSDKLIEERAGCTVAQIFAAQGEQAFRDLESSVLQELAASKAVMVSTGGGVVTREQNWESMRHGLVIWLTGPPELLAKRAVSDGTQSRPLLSQGSSGSSEVDILDKRQHMYAQADLHIPLEGSPGDPSDCGATPAVIAYRSAFILS
ncbi:shikimate kinase, partial [Coccomyxa subellipsoidea C-169]